MVSHISIAFAALGHDPRRIHRGPRGLEYALALYGKQGWSNVAVFFFFISALRSLSSRFVSVRSPVTRCVTRAARTIWTNERPIVIRSTLLPPIGWVSDAPTAPLCVCVFSRVYAHTYCSDTRLRCENIRWEFCGSAKGTLLRFCVGFRVRNGEGLYNRERNVEKYIERGRVDRAIIDGASSLLRALQDSPFMETLGWNVPPLEPRIVCTRGKMRSRRKEINGDTVTFVSTLVIGHGAARVHPVDRPGRTLLSHRLRRLNTPDSSFLFGSYFKVRLGSPRETLNRSRR